MICLRMFFFPPPSLFCWQKGIFNAMQIQSELRISNQTRLKRAFASYSFRHPPSPTQQFAFHLLSLTKKNVLFFAYKRKVEEVSVEMGFYYDDVAIYSDSMIYSNLRCFYQIKFIFCTKPRDVECIQRSDLLV